MISLLASEIKEIVITAFGLLFFLPNHVTVPYEIAVFFENFPYIYK